MWVQVWSDVETGASGEAGGCRAVKDDLSEHVDDVDVDDQMLLERDGKFCVVSADDIIAPLQRPTLTACTHSRSTSASSEVTTKLSLIYYSVVVTSLLLISCSFHPLLLSVSPHLLPVPFLFSSSPFSYSLFYLSSPLSLFPPALPLLCPAPRSSFSFPSFFFSLFFLRIFFPVSFCSVPFCAVSIVSYAGGLAVANWRCPLFADCMGACSQMPAVLSD